MASTALSCLLCVLCVLLFPPLGGAACGSFWDKYGNLQFNEDCFFSYNYNSQGPGVAVLVGSIIGCILLVLVCVMPILCFLCPCCLLYKVCRKKRNRTQQVALTTTNVVNHHGQPVPYQPSHPGYQPVPIVHGYGGVPAPTAQPQFHMENDSSLPPPLPLGPGGVPYPSPPPYSEYQQPPYNPSYDP
ncbi:protein shisa-5-like [Cynoglossus semilaevis]|uniref:protein shisa-5-like n=1 Tax=Cynoglossus semilaevis TaxID=244447 RepID=UPI0004957E2E|nr:protein shisa-5-like [Cynoglossus semilaevis]